MSQPRCTNCHPNGRTPAPATLRLWCPTWIGSERGPRDLCAECAWVFQPERNKHAVGGSWHWGSEADWAYQSVELNLPHNDPRYPQACRMAQQGTPVGEQTYVVDGKVWLVVSFNVLRLGDWPDARELFPELFSTEPVPA